MKRRQQTINKEKPIIKKRKEESSSEDEDAVDTDNHKSVEKEGEIKPSTAKWVPKSRQQPNAERQLRSLLNKLSITNLEAIANELEKLYSEFSRNEVNTQLIEVVLSYCTKSGHVLSSSTALTAQSALLAIMHIVIGTELGATFLERLVASFEEFYKKKDSLECSNLMTLLTHLYNFQVVHCTTVYGLIQRLVASFQELDLELLLLLLKTCGPQLRSDDPVALKEIILLVQQQAIKHNIRSIDNTEDGTSSKPSDGKTSKSTTNNSNNNNNSEEDDQFGFRARFFVQTIYDLKNNKMRSQSEDSTVFRTRKAVRAFLQKRGLPLEDPLRVPWNDLVNAKEIGRWWVVGSAWSGQGGVKSVGQTSKSEQASVESDGSNQQQLLALAKAQRMNTDIRRSVFCVIMSGSDFMDTFEKLLKLNLNNKQDREIIYVLMHCCSQEKIYNPYYFHLATKLCAYHKNYRFTLQLSFWDKFKLFSSMTARNISNLAQLLASLVSNGSLPLSMLKVVEFHRLDSHGVLFFRIFFNSLLTKNEEKVVIEIFQRAVAAKDAVGVKEGMIHFFIQEELHHISKTEDNPKSQRAEEQLMYLKRTKIARRILEKASRADVFNF